MVTRRLARLGAYDLQDDWSDVCQEIVWSLVRSAREGRGPRDDKLAAYVAQAVWNRYASLLRRRGFRDCDPKEETLVEPRSDDDRLDIDRVQARQAFARLPRATQQLLWARYVEGSTIDAIVDMSGRSRASVNRDLAAARAQFATLLGLAMGGLAAGGWEPAGAIDDTMQAGSQAGRASKEADQS